MGSISCFGGIDGEKDFLHIAVIDSGEKCRTLSKKGPEPPGEEGVALLLDRAGKIRKRFRYNFCLLYHGTKLVQQSNKTFTSLIGRPA